MASSQNDFDVTSIGQVQTQMHQADQECIQAYNAVTTTLDFITTAWDGAARGAYINAMTRWIEDLNVIRGDLHKIIDSMHSHGQTSTEMEQDNVDLSGAWALPAS